jgi:hypothetical protein
MSDGAKMTGDRSYSDISDSATTFDPEEQFDRDIDERIKGMTKEEAVAKAIYEGRNGAACKFWKLITEAHKAPYLADARAAIAAADKWDAEEKARTCTHPLAMGAASMGPDGYTMWRCPDCGASFDDRKPAISPGLDSAIQEELDRPPASIMEEGK